MWNNHSRTVESAVVPSTRKSNLFYRVAGYKLLFLFLIQVLFVGASNAQNISEKVGDLEASEGFFTYYFDEGEDKLWVRVTELNKEFLYANYLAAGVGSNDIGLDRIALEAEKEVLHM